VIVDTSALVAILRDEPDAEWFALALEVARTPKQISAANYLEASIVLDRAHKSGTAPELDELIQSAGITIEPVTPAQARIAREAYRRYGRGAGHPANLNFGDCFAYALAQDKRQPLLFKGADFSQTDAQPVDLPTSAS
jgi:ribonuclease VapC